MSWWWRNCGNICVWCLIWFIWCLRLIWFVLWFIKLVGKMELVVVIIWYVWLVLIWCISCFMRWRILMDGRILVFIVNFFMRNMVVFWISWKWFLNLWEWVVCWIILCCFLVWFLVFFIYFEIIFWFLWVVKIWGLCMDNMLIVLEEIFKEVFGWEIVSYGKIW